MLNKFITVILICFVLLSRSYGQERSVVSGIIREKTTKEILSNATVKIAGNVSVSNDRGYFSVDVEKGQNDITVSYIGFESYRETLYIGRDTALIVELEEGVTLSEVVVEYKKTSLRSVSSGTIQMDVAQLRKIPLFLGERDVIKALQFLPGVSSGMEGSSGLNIRGGTNDQTLYLMDDVPVYNQNHTFGLVSIFNPDILRSADIYKGGIPATYGNRLSGIANIYLKDGNLNRHRQSVSVGLLSASVHLEGPVIKDKWSYSVSARRSLFDLIIKGINSFKDYASGESFAFHDINAKTTLNIGKKTNLSLQYYNGYDDLSGFNDENIVNPASKEKYNENFGYGWKTTMASLRVTSALSPGLFLSSALYYSSLDNFRYFQAKYEAPDANYKLKNRIFSDLNEYGFKSRFEHKTSRKNTLLYGTEMSRQFFKPDYMERTYDKHITLYRTKELSLNTVGVFIYNELLLDEWQYSFGVRASMYESNSKKVKYAIEPRIKISRLLNDNNKITLAYDYSTQPSHSVYEMNYTVKSDYRIPFQENRLPAAQQYSAGWKNHSIPHLTVTADVYWKQMKNLLRIDNLEYFIDNNAGYVTGKGESYGLEMMMQYEYQRFSSWLSYTLSKSTRTFEDKTYPFKYDSPNDISAFISYDVYKKKERTNAISLNIQYHTGVPYSVASAEYPGLTLPSYDTGYYYDMFSVSYIPPYPNTRLPDYFRMDINYTMEKKLKNGTSRIWQFSFLNATGHVNPYAVYKNEKDDKYKAFLLLPFMPSLSYTRYF
jgi:hypothetical protein